MCDLCEMELSNIEKLQKHEVVCEARYTLCYDCKDVNPQCIFNMHLDHC